jgi:O-methyltransferase
VSDSEIVQRALPYTMTGAVRLEALVGAVRRVVADGVPGAFAECGVWRGGSVLAMALTLLDAGDTDRELWLYDTFTGMTEPGELDVSPRDGPARAEWERAQRAGERAWPELFSDFPAGSVRATVLDSGYPAERVRLVAGPVEETIPAQAPGALALLRLDTDWYESTRHELEHLYPRLAPGGVLIVDDYGHWEGARRAVDEYFEAHPPRPELVEVDYTCRLAVRP